MYIYYGMFKTRPSLSEGAYQALQSCTLGVNYQANIEQDRSIQWLEKLTLWEKDLIKFICQSAGETNFGSGDVKVQKVKVKVKEAVSLGKP